MSIIYDHRTPREKPRPEPPARPEDDDIEGLEHIDPDYECPHCGASWATTGRFECCLGERMSR